MTRCIRRILVSFFLLSVCSLAHAQSAQIQGQIFDTAGAAVPKASVRVVDQRTGADRKTESNGSGQYTVPGLNPSEYKVLVQASGFSAGISNTFTLNAGQKAVLDFNLQIGSSSSEVVVNADNLSVNTTDASVSTMVDRQFVENLPLNGRTFQSLLSLTPGEVVTQTSSPGDEGQFSVAGQRAGANYFSIDGVSANFAAPVSSYQSQTANGALPAFSALGSTASLVSVDDLQEFRINTSTYAPEYGRESGGVILLATRAGTNTFHGSAFDYIRNDVFDAVDWFANNTGQSKPRENQNDFGGVFGGPIRRDKTFFFFSYEGLRVTQPLFQISQVPSVAARASAAASVKAVVNAFPLPNGPAVGADLAQLAASSPNHSTLNASSLRLDHAVNANVTLFGRFNFSPSRVVAAYSGFLPSNPFTTTTKTTTGTFGITAALKPGVVNDFRFNYSKAAANSRQSFGDFDGAVIPPSSAVYSPFQDPSMSGLYMDLLDGLNTDLATANPRGNLNRQLNVTDSVTVSKGSHLMKFGFDFRRLTPVLSQQRSISVYLWLTTASFVNGAVPDISEYDQDHGNVQQLYRNFAGFAQDTWKASPKLTLTYGIRWDYNPPPSETNGAMNAPYAISQINDLSTATFLPQGSPLWHADWKNFAPRLGVTYQFGRETSRPLVLRAGFGQMYDLGTSTAGFLDNGEGWVPYSTSTALCLFGAGSGCTGSIPYPGPEPPFSLTGGSNNVRVFDPHLKLPYSLEWSIALEQTLSPNDAFAITYVGSDSKRLLRDDVIANPSSATNDIAQRLFLTRNTGYANYNALQVQYQRRMLHNFQALVSYSWSHSLDLNSSDVTYSTPPLPDTLYNIRQDYGNSDFDVRNGFSAALTYNIPTGRIQNGFAKTLLRDWSLDSINVVRSGKYFNVLYTPADPASFTDGVGNAYQFRPDLVHGQSVWSHEPGAPGGKVLNLAAFSIPAELRQGTEGRNSISGFPLFEMDLGVRRELKLAELTRLQLRADIFNVPNHPNFGNPLNAIGTCALGVPCTPVSGWGVSQAMLNQNLGSGDFHGAPLNGLYQVGGPRSIQVSAKLQF